MSAWCAEDASDDWEACRVARVARNAVQQALYVDERYTSSTREWWAEAEALLRSGWEPDDVVAVLAAPTVAIVDVAQAPADVAHTNGYDHDAAPSPQREEMLDKILQPVEEPAVVDEEPYEDALDNADHLEDASVDDVD